jgi:hypothetical protein
MLQASPRGEDLTKIKFARFHFNGVNTTLLDRKTKSLSTGSTGVGESPHHEDPDVKKLKAAGLLPDSTSADSAQAAGGGSKMVPVAHGGKSSGRYPGPCVDGLQQCNTLPSYGLRTSVVCRRLVPPNQLPPPFPRHLCHSRMHAIAAIAQGLLIKSGTTKRSQR